MLQSAVLERQGLTVNTAQLISLDGQHHTVDMTLIPLEQGEQLKPLSLLELRQVDQQRRIHQQLTLDAQQQAAQYLVRNLAHEIKNRWVDCAARRSSCPASLASRSSRSSPHSS